jgi:hypothetical protein
MSTRAQIKITDSFGRELWFYRHSDGYPDGTLPTLQKFLDWVKEGKIRDNVEQAAGWLILIGAEEYGKTYDYKTGTSSPKATLTEPLDDKLSGWKCGAYEPCACGSLHGDVEYLYTVSLKKKEIKIQSVRGYGDEQTLVDIEV